VMSKSSEPLFLLSLSVTDGVERYAISYLTPSYTLCITHVTLGLNLFHSPE
jgi:hypothetical protein